MAKKESTEKTKNKKEKKTKLSAKAVIKDSAYAIKLIAGTSPALFVTRLLSQIMYTVISFIVGTYSLRYIINSFEDGLTFKTVALSALVLVAVIAVIAIFRAAQFTLKRLKAI